MRWWERAYERLMQGHTSSTGRAELDEDSSARTLGGSGVDGVGTGAAGAVVVSTGGLGLRRAG